MAFDLHPEGPRSGPLVSVVLNVYNRIDEICETLERLRKTSYTNIEIIVVDDHSSNNVSEVLREKFPEVTTFRLHKNFGAIVSRNFGMGAAAGKYVVVLDDDSFPGSRCIARMVDEFERDEKLGVIAFQVREYESFSENGDGDQERTVTEPYFFTGCGVAFRRSLFAEIGYWEDWFSGPFEVAYSLRAISAGYRLLKFSDIYVFHKVSPFSRPTEKRNFEGAKNLYLFYWQYYPFGPMIRSTIQLLFHCCFLAVERRKLAYLRATLAAFSCLHRALRQRRPVGKDLLGKYHLTLKTIGLCL